MKDLMQYPTNYHKIKTQQHTTARGVGGRLKMPKKNPARAGWPRRLALVRATLRAEVDVIGAQLCSCARAVFSG